MIFITRRLKNRYLQIFDFYCFRFMHGQASIEVKMRWDFSFFFFSFFWKKYCEEDGINVLSAKLNRMAIEDSG